MFFLIWVLVLLLRRSIVVNALLLAPAPAPANTRSALASLLRENRRKTPGSLKWKKLWRTWSRSCVVVIREGLRKRLSLKINHDETQALEFELGVAADVGEMPSFKQAGARSGYALNHFGRALRTADLLLEYTSSQSEEALSPTETTRLCSIGAGPGYDHCAAALVSLYTNKHDNKVKIEALVLDYEEGWADVAKAMGDCVNSALDTEHECRFDRCDITVPLTHPSNAPLHNSNPFDIYICQYCVAENRNRLIESEYIFFRQLFHRAKDGSLFIFTETTHRLWPDFLELIEDGYQVEFPKRQMVLRKRDGATISQETWDQADEFRADLERHQEKIDRGWVRQKRKIRGAKPINENAELGTVVVE